MPSCGIRAFSLWLDGNLLFSGELRKWSSGNGEGQSVLFTDNAALIEREERNVRGEGGVKCRCIERRQER